MAQFKLVAVDQPDLAPFPISERLRSQIVYFIAPDGTEGMPALSENEYWIPRKDVTHWLMEGVFSLVSPLDTENVTEVELSEEQDAMLSWLDKHKVEHVRVIES